MLIYDFSILNVGNIRKYYVEYYQSHITLFWVSIMNVVKRVNIVKSYMIN